MSPEFNKTEGSAERTQAIKPAEAAEPPNAVTPEAKGIFGSLRQAYLRAKEGRTKQAQAQAKPQQTVDRSKGLLVLAAAVVIMLFVYLALFSSSSGTKDRSASRSKPSLGRSDTSATEANENRGSVTPLLNADTSGQDGKSDQVSADDVRATGRLRVRPQPKSADTLASVPPMDPALEAYRQAKYPVAPTPAAVAAPPIAPPAAAVPHSEGEALKKSSLVFVRNVSSGSTASVAPATLASAPALLERPQTILLPSGTRLVARLQAAVNSAIKTPVVASIEYNYERNGEIIIPAGTKAFGDLQQANRNGNVGIRFHTLQLPDGTPQKIDAAAMSLNYGPLRGAVSGSNKAKRVLVRSLTGIGTMAAYLVGGQGGFGGLNGQLNNSVLLRERIASNAGLAGEQEMASLAFNENIVVSVPANTRFFIVLLEGSGERPPARTLPAAGRSGTQFASDGASALPSAQEIRELLELKAELNRMYREVASTRTTEPAASPQQP
jgi:hypothetical protein